MPPAIVNASDILIHSLALPDHVGRIRSRVSRVSRSEIRNRLFERATLRENMVDEVAHKVSVPALSA
jgi:hypothetical protein